MRVWEVLRGLAYGAALVQEAEDQAIYCDCPRVFLATISFQALPFYKKRVMLFLVG